MRIVGGKQRGKRLSSPAGTATRPTTDRVRENLFNILENRIDFDGIRVMDMFAGSGALGFEALSRGAEFCLFVETGASQRAIIRENADQLGLESQSRIFRRDARRLGELGTMHPFNLVFADPPYAKAYGEQAAQALLQGGWIRPGGLFVLEEQKSALPETIPGFETVINRSYGSTSVGLFEVLASPSI